MSFIKYFRPNEPADLEASHAPVSSYEQPPHLPVVAHLKDDAHHSNIAHDSSSSPVRRSVEAAEVAPTYENDAYHSKRETNTSGSDTLSEKDYDAAQLENIRTIERVGTHKNYYEKDGLRTEGDGQEHHIEKLGAKSWLALLALSFCWTGSQIPVYLLGGIPFDIYGDIGGVDRWVWMIVGNLLALAAICPFVGSLSDLIGRRYVAISGSVLIIIGMIVVSTAHSMNIVIGGMVIAGAGAGINELTALAGTAELVPTAKRGAYVGGMIFTILPWCPSVLYAQLINRAAGWRYVGLVCAVWAFVGLVLVVLFYNPPDRVNSEGYSRRKILARIDYVGGLLSIGGVVLFLMGIQWGGYQYKWSSVHVLVPLILGAVLLIVFVIWEGKFAKYPLFPKRLLKDGRVLTLVLIITFVSGANFFAILFFWPTEAFNVYGTDPVGIGLRGLPIGFSILLGAIVCLVLIGVTKGRIRLLLIFFSAVMTAGVGSMAVALPNNLYTMWGLVILAGIGIGGIVVPCSIITTIICPDDLIATITAITLSIRVLGGAIGYSIYYNVFYNKLVPKATEIIGLRAVFAQVHIFDPKIITEAVVFATNSQYAQLRNLTSTFANPHAYDIILEATHWAMAEAYAWVYYVSIAFGVVSFICACFVGDISQYMDDHVAVVMH